MEKPLPPKRLFLYPVITNIRLLSAAGFSPQYVYFCWMNYLLFDPPWRSSLLPLAYTRPVCDFRLGLLSIREKWEQELGSPCSTRTVTYLQEKFPARLEDENIYINGALLPGRELADAIRSLGPGQSLWQQDRLLAMRCGKDENPDIALRHGADAGAINYEGEELHMIRHLWDLFLMLGDEIEKDIRERLGLRVVDQISDTNLVIGDRLYVDPSAKIEGASINSETGPVYIGPHSEVMEGACIRGPFALGEHSTVKMGAKIYGATAIGPHCKVGGEINNSNLFGYSNKAHDGFLGNAVIGEWCNLGADTNNSNLKNNYAEVKIWNYEKRGFINTGLQFCGLFMGDHSKSGINTMFNTGTVVGVSANIFGGGFPRQFIPSFSWGGAVGMKSFRIEKALEVARAVMKRRGKEPEQAERKILEHIFEISGEFRNY